jgi:hypothetical protein
VLRSVTRLAFLLQEELEGEAEQSVSPVRVRVAIALGTCVLELVPQKQITTAAVYLQGRCARGARESAREKALAGGGKAH